MNAADRVGQLAIRDTTYPRLSGLPRVEAAARDAAAAREGLDGVSGPVRGREFVRHGPRTVAYGPEPMSALTDRPFDRMSPCRLDCRFSLRNPGNPSRSSLLGMSACPPPSRSARSIPPRIVAPRGSNSLRGLRRSDQPSAARDLFWKGSRARGPPSRHPNTPPLPANGVLETGRTPGPVPERSPGWGRPMGQRASGEPDDRRIRTNEVERRPPRNVSGTRGQPPSASGFVRVSPSPPVASCSLSRPDARVHLVPILVAASDGRGNRGVRSARSRRGVLYAVVARAIFGRCRYREAINRSASSKGQ